MRWKRGFPASSVPSSEQYGTKLQSDFPCLMRRRGIRKNGIESVLPQLPPITLGIVGEPTEMHPAIAEKGLMVIDVTAHGGRDMRHGTKETMPSIKSFRM